MANLTITISEESLKKARLRALEEGTSVNELLRDFLESYAGVDDERKNAIQEIIELSLRSESRRGNARWTRDELHERA